MLLNFISTLHNNKRPLECTFNRRCCDWPVVALTTSLNGTRIKILPRVIWLPICTAGALLALCTMTGASARCLTMWRFASWANLQRPCSPLRWAIWVSISIIFPLIMSFLVFGAPSDSPQYSFILSGQCLYMTGGCVIHLSMGVSTSSTSPVWRSFYTVHVVLQQRPLIVPVTCRGK